MVELSIRNFHLLSLFLILTNPLFKNRLCAGLFLLFCTTSPVIISVFSTLAFSCHHPKNPSSIPLSRTLQDNKNKSRNNARRSISLNSKNADAYKLIGNLYMGSYDDCKEGKSRVQDRLVFIAAYNIFKSGGLTSQANQAREQFPSMEEIFNENYNISQS